MWRASKNWDDFVEAAEEVARSAGFGALRARIVELANPQPGDVVVDVGSGTGLLTLAIADRAGRVWAIDSSAGMRDYLLAKAESAELTNVRVVLASATSLPLVDGVADVVVSNYCFHELREPEKQRALREAYRVLRPGGRLVVGDMMFSLSPSDTRGRQLMLGLVWRIARRGLPGLWRIAKNLARLATGRWEHPAGQAWWEAALRGAGFEDARIELTGHEAGVAYARRPAELTDMPAGQPPAGRSQPGRSPSEREHSLSDSR
ncbi:MAG: class I SAM-dependent methyltransferase [Solirubrobacteraceae bacterium]